MTIVKHYLFMLITGVFFLATKGFALPFSIVPIGNLPTVISPGSTAAASYTVTNITSFNPPFNLVKWLPPNVAINPVGTTCTPPSAFPLSPGQSCRLNLTISGFVNRLDPDPHHHLFVCMSDKATCAGPSPENSLNVGGPTAATTFISVGQYQTSRFVPLSYTSTDGGVTWAVSTTLPPAQGPGTNSLSSVACDSSKTLCTAVGTFVFGVGSTHPSSYTSTDSGKNWAVSTTQPPAISASNNRLSDTTCDSSGQQCVAVGSYDSGGISHPLSYTSTDGGKNWVVSTTLPPAQGAGSNFLFNVACDSSGQLCTAVGFYVSGGIFLASSYTSTDGGKKWVVSTTLPPAQGAGSNSLESVACDSSGQLCTAVGNYSILIGGPAIPLSYISTDGGKNWAVSTTLPPAQGIGTNRLNGVACSSSGQQCVAVGFYASSGRNFPVSYTSTDGGKNWTVSLPPTQGTTNTELNDVACDSSGQRCNAVGSYSTGSIPPIFPLNYTSTDGGKNWAFSTTLPPPVGTLQDLLGGVG